MQNRWEHGKNEHRQQARKPAADYPKTTWVIQDELLGKSAQLKVDLIRPQESCSTAVPSGPAGVST